MADLSALTSALAPLLAHCQGLDLKAAPAARASLAEAFPVGGPVWNELKALFAEGRDAGWLAYKENAGVRFSRVLKANAGGTAFSVDAVHMSLFCRLGRSPL